MRNERVNGRTVKVYESGDGIRRRYRDSLDPKRFTYPRRGLLHHERAWYLSEKPAARPAFGVYALAAFAEDMLWRAKNAKKGRRPTYEDAVRFFAETRRALQNVLSTYSVGRPLTQASARKLRTVVAGLVESARGLVERMDNAYLTRDAEV